MQIHFSLLASESDKFPQPADLPWEHFVQLLTTFSTRDDKLGSPAWVPVTYKTKEEGIQISPVGGMKLNANVKTINVAVFDLDEVPYGPGETPEIDPKTQKPKKGRKMRPDEWAGVLQRVEASGYAAIVHTSFRHTPEAPKGRVIIPYSRPVLPGEHLIVRDFLDQKLQLHADPSTKDLTRLYYLPVCPAERRPFASAGTTDGRLLVDVETIVKGHRVETLTASANQIAESKMREAMDAVRLAEQEPVDLDQLRDFLRSSQGKNSDLLKAAMKGEAFAPEGERDNALNRLASAARFAVPAKTPSGALVEIFREAISKLEHKPGEDWLAEAYRKFERHQQRRVASDAARTAAHEELQARLRAESSMVAWAGKPRAPAQESAGSGDDPGSSDPGEDPAPAQAVGPYSDQELAEFAGAQGCQDVLAFQKRWIITFKESHYHFVEGRYLQPLPTSNIFFSLQRDFARAPGIELFSISKKGDKVRRPLQDIRLDYGTIARFVQADLALQKSFYEPASQTFYEAVTPLRLLTPRNHPEVQHWLDLLDPSQKITDWFAGVPRLERQLCAVYIDGPKSIGKSLLAAGLARLWTTGGPTSFRSLGSFQDAIVNCPLIFADEALPNRKGITAEIREMIGSTSRDLNRKFLPVVTLRGALRLVIAGNNDRILETGEELSANDLEAVASRIYYLKTDHKAANYLKEIGGPPTVQRWIDSDAIAEHALYLRQTRKLNESSRFLVEGDTSQFHRQLAIGAGLGGAVAEWIVRYLADVNPLTTPLVQVGSGEIWINTEALAKENNWVKYAPGFPRVPSANTIARALRGFSRGSIDAQMDGHTVTFHIVDADVILTHAQRLQVGDFKAQEARVKSVENKVISSVRAASAKEWSEP